MGERRSSINIQKVNFTSYEHNNRNYKPNYLVETGLKNEYFNNSSLPMIKVNNNYGEYDKPDFDLIKKDLEQKYTKTVGQKPQKNTEFFKEAVFNTSEKTTNAHIVKLCNELKKQFNMTVVNVAHHKDEGHLDKKTGKIKVNYHAHLVFVNADMKTGKSLRLKKADLVKMQTVVAECLELERGERGSKTVRLDHKQYKQEIKKDDILAKNIEQKAYEDVGKFFADKINKVNKVNNELSELNDDLIDENTKLKNELSDKKYAVNNDKDLFRYVNSQNDFYKSIFDELGLDEVDLMQFIAKKTDPKDIAKELREKLEERYKNERNELIKSGEATQQQYTQLKKEFEQQKLVIKELNNEIKSLKPEPIKSKSLDIDIGR